MTDLAGRRDNSATKPSEDDMFAVFAETNRGAVLDVVVMKAFHLGTSRTAVTIHTVSYVATVDKVVRDKCKTSSRF